MRRHESLDIALEELERAGIRDVYIERGRHVKVRWGRRMYSMSSTPSDWRVPTKVKSDIRRMLRADGRSG
jgi:hypothetical protein